MFGADELCLNELFRGNQTSDAGCDWLLMQLHSVTAGDVFRWTSRRQQRLRLNLDQISVMWSSFTGEHTERRDITHTLTHTEVVVMAPINKKDVDDFQMLNGSAGTSCLLIGQFSGWSVIWLDVYDHGVSAEWTDPLKQLPVHHG